MSLSAKENSKITDSHGTLTDAAVEIVEAACKLDSVTKVSLGIIRHVPGGGRRDLKFLPINSGIKAVVRGNGAVQEIYIYTKSPEEVCETIEAKFK